MNPRLGLSSKNVGSWAACSNNELRPSQMRQSGGIVSLYKIVSPCLVEKNVKGTKLRPTNARSVCARTAIRRRTDSNQPAMERLSSVLGKNARSYPHICCTVELREPVALTFPRHSDCQCHKPYQVFCKNLGKGIGICRKH